MTDVVVRRRARLNASLLLGVVLVGTIIQAPYVLTPGLGDGNVWSSVISIGGLLALLVGYFFSVSPRPAVAGLILVGVPVAGVWGMRWFGGLPEEIEYFLALPLMVAPFALSFRPALWLFGINLAIAFLAEPLFETDASEHFADHLLVAAFITIVSVVAAIAARAVENDVRELERTDGELRDSNRKLRDLDRSRLQFVNNVAHDLASPIHPVRLQLAVLERMPVIDGAQKKKSLDIMGRNVAQFERLLKDFGDVAKVEAGRLTLQLRDADLAALVREGAEGFSGTARDRGIQLEIEAPAPLPAHADAQRITQVLYNFLTNALKFTPKGGTVKVSALASGATAEIRVQDSGRGLTPDEAAKLFRPFAQVHDPLEYKERGTGLGLYICKGIVDAHGGSIGVLSDGRGLGSTFWFTVPLAGTPGAVPLNSPEAPPKAPR